MNLADDSSKPGIVGRALETFKRLQAEVNAANGETRQCIQGDTLTQRIFLAPDTLADLPVIKGFIVRFPSAGARSITRFYDKLDTEDAYLESERFAIREGDMGALARVHGYSGGLALGLDDIRRAMSENSKLIRMIHGHPDMPPAEKRQLIDNLYFFQIKMAQTGNQILDRVREARETILRQQEAGQ